MKIRMKDSDTVRNMLLKIISLAISFIATMLLTRIVVSKDGSEAYGFYSLSNDFVNYAMIISVALNSMASRYVTVSFYSKNAEETSKYFNSILYANIMLSAVFVIPMIFIVFKLDNIMKISPRYIGDVKILFLLMFLNFLLTIIFSIFNVSTFIKNRVDLDSLRSLESYIIRLILIFVLYFVFEPHVWYLAVGTLAGTIYVIFYNIYYVRLLTPEIILFNKTYVDYRYILKVIKSGIWNSFTRLGAIFLSGLDLLIANLYVSSLAMGILSIAKTIPKLIISAISSFSAVFIPEIMIAYAKNDKDELMKSIFRGIFICSLLSIIIQTIIIVLGKSIYSVWVPDQDIETIYWLSVISIGGYIILMPLECLYAIFTATNQVKVSSIYLFIESIIVILVVILGLNMSDNDYTKLFIIAGVSSFAEIIRGFTFLPIFSSKCLNKPVKVFYKQIIRIIIANTLSIILCAALFDRVTKSVFLILLKIILVTIICTILWWFIIPEQNFKNSIIEKIKRGKYEFIKLISTNL